MHWVFADKSTLVESVSGFVIHLMSGSWEQVEDVIPETPDDVSLSFAAQALLLREGLRFAASEDDDCVIVPFLSNVSMFNESRVSLN